MAFRDGWVSLDGLKLLNELMCLKVRGFRRRVGTYLSVGSKLHRQGPPTETKHLPGDPQNFTKPESPQTEWQTGLWSMVYINVHFFI